MESAVAVADFVGMWVTRRVIHISIKINIEYIYCVDIKYIRKGVCYLKAVSKSAKVSPEAKRIIRELKSGELEVRNVPEEFALDSNIVKAERKLGLRKSGHRGFDVIAKTYFVEEYWFHKDLSGNLVSRLQKKTFDSFEEYYRLKKKDI